MRRYLLTLAIAFAAAAVLPLSAQAADPFAVPNIHVDASAQSASVAQLAAIAQGRPKAWSVLYKRIAKQADWGKQPQLDDATLQRMIRSFTVKNERRSTTRYVGDVTYVFSPEGVARAMQGAGIAFALNQQKRILLVPFAPKYSSSSLWTAAFSGSRYAAAPVPFSLPSGGSEQALLSAANFDTASWADVGPAAARIHAAEAALVQVVQNNGHLTINIRRIGQAELPQKMSFDVAMLQGGAAGTYSNAADQTVGAIAEMWKKAPNVGQPGTITAEVRIASLAQFGAMQQTMSTIPNVTNMQVMAMDIGLARLQLAYIGGVDQLKEALSVQGITLARNGNDWSLSTGAQ